MSSNLFESSENKLSFFVARKFCLAATSAARAACLAFRAAAIFCFFVRGLGSGSASAAATAASAACTAAASTGRAAVSAAVTATATAAGAPAAGVPVPPAVAARRCANEDTFAAV